MFIGHLCVLSGEVSIQILCPFFNWIVCLPVFLWMSSLYVFELKPLSEVLLANMFSHTVGSLCILMLFSLAMQKLFILMRSHLFILSFMSLALEDVLAKILLHGISEIFLHMFSFKTFMVSWPVLQSSIHLQFILVYGISWWSSFIFLHAPFQISQHHFKKAIFTPFYASAPFVKY